MFMQVVLGLCSRLEGLPPSLLDTLSFGPLSKGFRARAKNWHLAVLSMAGGGTSMEWPEGQLMFSLGFPLHDRCHMVCMQRSEMYIVGVWAQVML
jgi:hypothetical protein